jgi:hypothetical protein
MTPGTCKILTIEAVEDSQDDTKSECVSISKLQTDENRKVHTPRMTGRSGDWGLTHNSKIPNCLPYCFKEKGTTSRCLYWIYS